MKIRAKFQIYRANAEWLTLTMRQIGIKLCPSCKLTRNEVPLSLNQGGMAGLFWSYENIFTFFEKNAESRLPSHSVKRFNWRKKGKILSFYTCNSHKFRLCSLLIFNGARHTHLVYYILIEFYAPLANRIIVLLKLRDCCFVKSLHLSSLFWQSPVSF
jgi:hypothetical protein